MCRPAVAAGHVLGAALLWQLRSKPDCLAVVPLGCHRHRRHRLPPALLEQGPGPEHRKRSASLGAGATADGAF